MELVLLLVAYAFTFSLALWEFFGKPL